jgi:hypothetical protein
MEQIMACSPGTASLKDTMLNATNLLPSATGPDPEIAHHVGIAADLLDPVEKDGLLFDVYPGDGLDTVAEFLIRWLAADQGT